MPRLWFRNLRAAISCFRASSNRRRASLTPPGKTPVATADIPAWVYTFTVADDFDRDAASSEELRAAYQEWEAAVRDWRATHETPSVEELLADPVAMADAPFNPNAEIDAGTL